ncbi:MAG: hypothetical protein AB7G11_06265 [Phycisphaerales bacterium]
MPSSRSVLARLAALAPAAAILSPALVAPAFADIFYDEGFAGDISNDRFNPTAFNLAAGDNQLVGVIFGDDGQGNIDRDYFSLTIPAGLQLSQIVHLDYISTDFGAFMGIEEGPIFPIDPDQATPGDLLGWVIFGPSTVGVDLLPTMGGNGRGFTPPLSAGTYTFWVQQTGDYTDYIMNFVVTEVPAPASAILLGPAAALAFRRRR